MRWRITGVAGFIVAVTAGCGGTSGGPAATVSFRHHADAICVRLDKQALAMLASAAKQRPARDQRAIHQQLAQQELHAITKLGTLTPPTELHDAYADLLSKMRARWTGPAVPDNLEEHDPRRVAVQHREQQISALDKRLGFGRCH
jgi:hypothetical protein